MRARLKLHAKRLGLVCGTLLVLCLMGEAALRLFHPRWRHAVTVRDPDVGHRFRRSWSADVYSPESDRMIPLSFNSVGMRDPERRLDKPEGTYRIAFLGDSMVAAIEVEREYTTVRRLEGLLQRSHPKTRWEVQNWGVHGSSPSGALLLYRKDVRRYKPDLVLYGYFVGNDIADVVERKYFRVGAGGGVEPVPYSTRRAAVSAWLNRNSYLYVWQKRVLHRLTHRDDAGVFREGDWIFCSEPAPEQRAAWEITAALLRAWKREVEADGSRFALVVIPSERQIYRDSMERIAREAGEAGAHFDADYPERRLRAICAAGGIAYFSLLDAFRAACPSASLKAEDELLFFVQGHGHMNERAQALAASEIYRFLTRRVAGGGEPLLANAIR